jgi:hypothetical protein
VATDDFVALRLEDGSRVQLVAIDALSGQFLGRRAYNNDGTGNVPINLALASDGTLVWVMPDRVCGKDLFEPSDRLTFDTSSGENSAAMIFAGANGPEHLQIADGRIFVQSDNGIYVRVYSLQTGQPLRVDNNDMRLSTGAQAGTWSALVRPSGRKLYVCGKRELASYDMENTVFTQSTQLASLTSIRPRDVFVTRGHVVILSEPAGPGMRPRRGGITTLQLQAVSRAPLDDKGRETGLLEYPFTLSDPATIQSWQPVDGGLYYLAGDQRLHFLKGARED